MSNILFEPEFYKWGERFTQGKRIIVSDEFLVQSVSAPWIQPVRLGLSSGQSPYTVLLNDVPNALATQDIVSQTLQRLPDLGALLEMVDDVFLGFSTNDTLQQKPLIGLTFTGAPEAYLVVAGAQFRAPFFPVEIEGIAAVTGPWIDIGIGPLTNFRWFLPMGRENETIIDNSFYPKLLTSRKRDQILQGEEVLPFPMWPNPEDCIVLGEIANGDLLIFLSKGALQGQIYVLAQEVPGPVNHLMNKDYLSWMEWVLQSSISDIKGEDWSRPWFY